MCAWTSVYPGTTVFPESSIALTDARIITLDDRRVIDRGTVIVRGGRITCVGRCVLKVTAEKRKSRRESGVSSRDQSAAASGGGGGGDRGKIPELNWSEV